MAYGKYVARQDAVSVSTAVSLIEITAPSTAICEITRMKISQSGTATGTALRVQALRKSAAGTGTSFTPVPTAAGMPAAGSTARHTITSEGTASTIEYDEGFNNLAGWEWVAFDELSRIIVPPSGIFAIKFAAVPGSAQTVSALIEFIEKG